MNVVTDWLRRLRRDSSAALAAITDPLPRIEVRTAAFVPAWVLRLVLLALGVTTMIILGAHGLAVAVLGAFLIAVLVRPGSQTGALFCLAVGALLIFFRVPALSPFGALLLAVTTAVTALASSIEQLPLSARVEWRALWPAARRYLVIQLISQPMVLLAALLQLRPFGSVWPAVGAAAVVALAVWVLLPRLSRDR